MPSPESYAVLFHTDRFPPLLVDLDTPALSGDGLPDEATALAEEEAPELYMRGHAAWSDPVVVRDRNGEVCFLPRRPLREIMATSASVMVEETESGLWRRYRAAPLDHEAIVLLVLSSGWASYGRVTVEPSFDAGRLGRGTALPLAKLLAILAALEAKGQVVHAPNRHGVSRWIYLPEAPVCHLPKVERAVATWTVKSHLLPEEIRGLDAALRAYIGVMGESYDPNRRVAKLWIDDITGQVYAKVSGEDRLPAPVFLSYALADMKRELAADLPPGAFSPPRY